VTGPVLDELGRLLLHLLAHPFEAGAERGQHRLLALDHRRPFAELGLLVLGRGPFLLEPFVLGLLGGEGGVDLPGLLFQFQ